MEKWNLDRTRERERERERKERNPKVKCLREDSNFTSFRSRPTNDSIDARHALTTGIFGFS